MLVGNEKDWLGAYTTLRLTTHLAADQEPRALPVRGRRYTLDFTPPKPSSFYACTMPRFIRRRHRLRDGQNFLSDTVPTDYTFDRLASKLKEFRASTAKLRLVHSSTPMPTHWARQREAEHMRAVQERQQASAAAARAAAAGEPAPKPTLETEVDEGKAPPEGTFAGARPADLQSRLLVLDASFNPPTRAHAHMAKAAVHAVLEEQRAAVAEAERCAALVGSVAGGGGGVAAIVRPETRLVLLLAVANADKPAAPAPLEHRLAMIYAFARHLHDDLRRQGDSVPIEMALTSEAFFSGKAHALRTASWYPHMRPLMTFKKCDERGRKLPGKATIPPMEFITGFDTLVRILDPKYYKDEPDDAAIGEDPRGKDDDDGVAVAAEVSQNDADSSEAAQSASCEGKGKEKMVAEEPSAQQQLQHPSQPDDLTTMLAAKRPRNTPMMKALDPFFAHASLRVMLRPDDGHGTLEEQRAHIAALAAARDEETRASSASASAMGVRSLDEVGGDTAWMHKVRVLPDEVTGGAAAGVSSSQVRRLVHDQGPLAAQGLVYPLVLDWLKRRELYRRPRPPKGTFADDGGLVEITAFGAWRKEDFCD